MSLPTEHDYWQYYYERKAIAARDRKICPFLKEREQELITSII